MSAFEWLVVVILILILVVVWFCARLALASAEEAGRAARIADETRAVLQRTMQVNAYFHAKTYAAVMGDPEPKQPGEDE